MRHLLPITLLAAVLIISSATALAKKGHERDHGRVGSHISLHVSTHHVLGGRRIVVRGRVRPRGSHRVKVVVRGPRGAVLGQASSRHGAFAMRWRPRRVGSYRIRAFGLHDRRVRGLLERRSPGHRLL